MPFVLVSSYTLFSFFLFYQQLHVKNFRGASEGFYFLLNAFAFISMLGGLAFLLYYGYKISWLDTLALFGISFVVKAVWFSIEAKLELRNLAPFISLIGFIGIPVCGYFMWWSLPQWECPPVNLCTPIWNLRVDFILVSLNAMASRVKSTKGNANTLVPAPKCKNFRFTKKCIFKILCDR